MRFLHYSKQGERPKNVKRALIPSALAHSPVEIFHRQNHTHTPGRTNVMNHEKPYPPVDYNNGHDRGHPHDGPPPPAGSVHSGHHPHPPPAPPSTHITMNTDPTPGASVTEINLNIGYFKTLPGILKLIQLVRMSHKKDFSIKTAFSDIRNRFSNLLFNKSNE